MSSPISSSDAAPGWGRWLGAFLLALIAGVLLVYAIVLIVDPYDSGRFGLLGFKGVTEVSPRFAHASHASDPDFDSAVIGNSTGQILNPETLSRLTGLRFVQLTVFLTGPGEQLALLDFFARNHPRIGALVLVADQTWCTHDPALPEKAPFPYWLYSRSFLPYLGRLFSSRALGNAWQRVLLRFGLRHRGPKDGYLSYEAFLNRPFEPDHALQDTSPDAARGKINRAFPGVARLTASVARLPEETALVIVAPPAFYTKVPRPGSIEAAETRACHAALREVIGGRPHSDFIDYLRDNATTRDAANFHDYVHYGATIARQIENDIAQSIRPGDKPAIGF